MEEFFNQENIVLFFLIFFGIRRFYQKISNSEVFFTKSSKSFTIKFRKFDINLCIKSLANFDRICLFFLILILLFYFKYFLFIILFLIIVLLTEFRIEIFDNSK